MAPLILASRSPVRLRLLAAAGLAAEAVPARVDERAFEASLDGAPGPAAVATALALAKAREVAARHPGRTVVGADQTLDLDGRRFGRPGPARRPRRSSSPCRAAATPCTPAMRWCATGRCSAPACAPLRS